MSASSSTVASGGRDLRELETWGGSEKAVRSIKEFLDKKDGKGGLSLDDCGLKEVPSEIGHLVEMTELDVSNNRELESLPDSLSHCTRLCELDCQNTKLTEIPSWIGKLTALEVLDCSRTAITVLPDSLVHCTLLSALDCNNTKLTEIPSWIGEFAGLSVLYCRNTSITALPESLAGCAELQWLDFHNTKLTALPANLWRCVNLLYLDVSSCESLEFPPPEVIAQIGAGCLVGDGLKFILGWLRENDGARPIKAVGA